MKKLIEAMQDSTWETMPNDLKDEIDWGAGGRVHNWRNHVPYSVQRVWGELSSDERNIAWLYARREASTEEWE